MKKFIFKLLFKILILLFLIVLAIGGLGFFKYKESINNKSLTEAILEIKSANNYTKIENISKDYIDSAVAIEDHRFYNHRGYDLLSILRSLYVNFKQKSIQSGASTITQQLARNIYFTQEQSPIRKFAEIFVAIDLEKNYSKQEILELYLNIIYFGNGYYGIHDASYGFFNKSPKELTFYEATYLAGLPNAPSIYSQDKKLGEERRLQVVDAVSRYIK